MLKERIQSSICSHWKKSSLKFFTCTLGMCTCVHNKWPLPRSWLKNEHLASLFVYTNTRWRSYYLPYFLVHSVHVLYIVNRENELEHHYHRRELTTYPWCFDSHPSSGFWEFLEDKKSFGPDSFFKVDPRRLIQHSMSSCFISTWQSCCSSLSSVC